jgi:hypothetical protein
VACGSEVWRAGLIMAAMRENTGPDRAGGSKCLSFAGSGRCWRSVKITGSKAATDLWFWFRLFVL